MTTAQIADIREIKEIRRELVSCGVDPFEIAAQAVAESRRYRRLLEEMRVPIAS